MLFKSKIVKVRLPEAGDIIIKRKFAWKPTQLTPKDENIKEMVWFSFYWERRELFDTIFGLVWGVDRQLEPFKERPKLEVVK